MAKHPRVEATPNARKVGVVRYCKPGQTSQLAVSLTTNGARRRADKLRAEGADVAVYVAKVSEWERLA